MYAARAVCRLCKCGKMSREAGRRKMKEKLYTAGELAKLAGVSLRTIRFYDGKGLLKPVGYSEAGYRYYNEKSVQELQRILMLKYLGFSLQQIQEMTCQREDADNLLAGQKEMLQKKKRRLEEMISTIEIMEQEDSENRWGYLIRLLNLLTEEEKIQEQYKNANNLEARIRLHQGYSTAKVEWVDWVYERLGLQEGQCVLELGCGNGQLWYENARKLPKDMHLVLTDRSEGMLQQTRERLAEFSDIFQERNISVEFEVMDANELKLAVETYDCIVANHMLYHVEDRAACFRAVNGALKPEGRFCCATNGEEHMKELHELVAEFDERIEMPYMGVTSGFRLENGAGQLAPFFSKVECEGHENGLLVDDPRAIYDYVYSYPGNSSCILEQRGAEFMELLRMRIAEEGSIFIKKDCGMFVCGK